MPVRFRCVYCNQLLGISSRKAGTVVRCTNCEGQIIVPDVEPALQFAGGERKTGPGKERTPLPNDLFERNDLDELFKPFDFDKPTPVAEAEGAIPPCPAPASAPDEPIAKRRFVVSRVAMGWSLTAVVTFIAGYFVGRASMLGP